MKISVFNGSPRGEESNSSVIIRWLLEGMNEEIFPKYLKKISEYKRYIEEVESCEKILIVFPLYTDAMPGIVMEFFEGLYAAREKLKGKEYLFVVHSGFPEAKQSYPVKRYLESFVGKMDGRLIGVIVNGGSEAIRIRPERMQKKKRNAYRNIGRSVSGNGKIAQSDIDILLRPVLLSKFALMAFKLLSKTNVTNMYWNILLKKNNAYAKRFDRPYK